ncbi:MAG: type II toxin-antitoxin system VapC family toxin [Pseudomonadota bacterium]|nr:PIN domain-containing protein [Rhodocyclaceae bacterium]
MRVLVDTGPLVALADRRDGKHETCKRWLRDFRGELITTWAVLTEVAHLTPSVTAGIAILRWIREGGMAVLPLGEDELALAVDWMERYADRPMDLADASLIVAALKTGITAVWTLDRSDFDVYRLPNRRRFRTVAMP